MLAAIPRDLANLTVYENIDAFKIDSIAIHLRDSGMYQDETSVFDIRVCSNTKRSAVGTTS